MRRLIASSTLLALAATGGLVSTSGADAASTTQTARRTPTSFAFKAYAFGSRAHGGQVPAGSGNTAFQVIGCTNDAGIDKRNHTAAEEIPGLGTASEITSRAWTSKSKKGVVASHSRNAIAKLTLADTPAGSLSLEGIKSTARASHDDSGFHARTTAEIAKIVLTPPAGPAQELPVPDPGQSLEVPGVATIDMGTPKKSAGKDLARARVEVVTVTSAATGTKVHLAQSFAQLTDGIKSGLFGGYASGSRAKAADGHVTSGRTPYQPMPCQGTDGEVRKNATASTDLGDQLVVSGVEASGKANQTRTRAWGYEKGRIANVDLGNGQLVIDGIVGRVHVTRKGAHLKKLVRHATANIGTITFNGQTQTFPDTDVIDIPGVAKLERDIVKKVHGGLSVTALRITLLDGSGLAANLGEAKFYVKRADR
jgi:hypothetical protein